MRAALDGGTGETLPRIVTEPVRPLSTPHYAPIPPSGTFRIFVTACYCLTPLVPGGDTLLKLPAAARWHETATRDMYLCVTPELGFPTSWAFIRSRAFGRRTCDDRHHRLGLTLCPHPPCIPLPQEGARAMTITTGWG
jgi:hypothetical protein